MPLTGIEVLVTVGSCWAKIFMDVKKGSMKLRRLSADDEGFLRPGFVAVTQG
jgi:hypothetical protein